MQTKRRIARTTQYAAELLDALVRLDLPVRGAPEAPTTEAISERDPRPWWRGAERSDHEATTVRRIE